MPGLIKTEKKETDKQRGNTGVSAINPQVKANIVASSTPGPDLDNGKRITLAIFELQKKADGSEAKQSKLPSIFYRDNREEVRAKSPLNRVTESRSNSSGK